MRSSPIWVGGEGPCVCLAWVLKPLIPSLQANICNTRLDGPLNSHDLQRCTIWEPTRASACRHTLIPVNTTSTSVSVDIIFSQHVYPGYSRNR
ncbi:hypothetical protein C8Q76DRAFT_725294 [Earliella scabrosa]|nr:hypothetical protein C8Q76DRAFT_725294 [Earliella scabrosa]